ncbi:hypothetical protein OJ997_29450 [Solirubrobacter phytolaccae]|uniref:Uncharacterized protein n=1 Tax=Solirubrobacter phytolaccae TaxID=1404360 RepID=A0A9X3NIP4_9ACTN|nr:hypothetical protein [Solirubrobacter phytolaccae]MDA0184466.1 hypothetical protein [Solirubrobacter phytolaccae]
MTSATAVETFVRNELGDQHTAVLIRNRTRILLAVGSNFATLSEISR